MKKGVDQVDQGWGVVINMNQKKANGKGGPGKDYRTFEDNVILDVMTLIKPRKNINDPVEPLLDFN